MNFIFEENRIYLKDSAGKTVAEVNFPDIADGVVNIDHTFVDESLRGQGIAGQLLAAAAEKLRKENRKAYPTCSFAVKWFGSHPDYADIRVENPD
ncbi:MAG: GNAT family N-acetyltransferase [Clostridia bacterium]|nr:GNAT family N-acetyltransferase [Clostridia bacterium]MDR3645477.1 GNAT family N-acetyltransferase [Clostridia bacterium]